MTENEKKRIYHDLRTNNVRVIVVKKNYYTTYTFGRYRVNNYYDYINIAKADSKRPDVFSIIFDAEFDDNYPENDVYAIYIAAKNKSEGKEYTDPYKDIPVKTEIKNLTDQFGTEMLKVADEFLPYDISKQKKIETIKELKQFLAQKLKKYYTK